MTQYTVFQGPASFSAEAGGCAGQPAPRGIGVCKLPELDTKCGASTWENHMRSSQVLSRVDTQVGPRAPRPTKMEEVELAHPGPENSR